MQGFVHFEVKCRREDKVQLVTFVGIKYHKDPSKCFRFFHTHARKNGALSKGISQGVTKLGSAWHLIRHARNFTFKNSKSNKRNTLLLNAIRPNPTCLENNGAESAVIYAVFSNQPHKTAARTGTTLRQQHLAFTKPLCFEK